MPRALPVPGTRVASPGDAFALRGRGSRVSCRFSRHQFTSCPAMAVAIGGTRTGSRLAQCQSTLAEATPQCSSMQRRKAASLVGGRRLRVLTSTDFNVAASSDGVHKALRHSRKPAAHQRQREAVSDRKSGPANTAAPTGAPLHTTHTLPASDSAPARSSWWFPIRAVLGTTTTGLFARKASNMLPAPA